MRRDGHGVQGATMVGDEGWQPCSVKGHRGHGETEGQPWLLARPGKRDRHRFPLKNRAEVSPPPPTISFPRTVGVLPVASPIPLPPGRHLLTPRPWHRQGLGVGLSITGLTNSPREASAGGVCGALPAALRSLRSRVAAARLCGASHLLTCVRSRGEGFRRHLPSSACVITHFSF